MLTSSLVIIVSAGMLTKVIYRSTEIVSSLLSISFTYNVLTNCDI